MFNLRMAIAVLTLMCALLPATLFITVKINLAVAVIGITAVAVLLSALINVPGSHKQC
ncbi:hypothetical protein ACIPL1_09160 [Pseudomonas sp. NPDC090202]|uniref:hypothetical protein n=1 Tax=Pseudomonas sp. NPDC090202 TaxID=3364476 RepID=UPI00381FA938